MAGDLIGAGLGAGMLGTIMAFGAIAFVFALAVWIFTGLAFMAIAKKTRTPNGWLGFIPIANVYLMTQIAGLSGWWTLIIFAGIIPIIGSLATMAAMIYFMWLIAEKLGKPGWWSILMLIPIVNLVILYLMAWGK